MTDVSVSNCQPTINQNPISSLSISTLFEELQGCLREASAMACVMCDQNFADYDNETLQSYFNALVKHLAAAQSTSKLLTRLVCNK